MTHTDRSRLALGMALVLLGAWFLAVQYVPGLQDWAFGRLGWPLMLVGVGGLFALASLATWNPPLMVPASVIAGLGTLLYWQNLTGHWESWAYAWALIPGFAGVGILLSGLMRGRVQEAINSGGGLMFISLVMFLVFGSLLGGLAVFGQIAPLLLIAAGVVVLVRALIHSTRLPPPSMTKPA